MERLVFVGIGKKMGEEGAKVFRLHSAFGACGARELPLRRERLPCIGGLRWRFTVMKSLSSRREIPRNKMK